MDKITRISWNAFMNYFTQVTRLGKITKQDKYKMLVVYFFYYLLHKTYYAYDFIEGEVDEDGSHQPGMLVLNEDRMMSLINKFNSLLDCLSADSCFIRPMESDTCVPLISPIESDINITALITNDCEWDDPEFTGDYNMTDDPLTGFIFTNEPHIPNPNSNGDFITRI